MFPTALAPAFLARFSKSTRAATNATLHACMSSVRRVRALPCGVTVPKLEAIGGAEFLPKKNLIVPSGFWCASGDCSAAWIGKTYLSSRAAAGRVRTMNNASAAARATTDVMDWLLHGVVSDDPQRSSTLTKSPLSATPAITAPAWHSNSLALDMTSLL